MEERRKHPECLRQEDWGEIKEFVKYTTAYRTDLKETLENIRKEDKARFEILLAQIRQDKVDAQNQADLIIASIHANTQDQLVVCKERENRIRGLEHSRAFIAGIVALITVVLIPIALAIMK